MAEPSTPPVFAVIKLAPAFKLKIDSSPATPPLNILFVPQSNDDKLVTVITLLLEISDEPNNFIELLSCNLVASKPSPTVKFTLPLSKAEELL